MSNIAEFLDSSRALEDEDISLSKSVLKIISTPNDEIEVGIMDFVKACLLYTSPSPRDS